MNISVVLRTDKAPNAKGEYPIYIVITNKGMRKRVSLGLRAQKKDFNNGLFVPTAPNYALKNTLIQKKLIEVQGKALTAHIKDESIFDDAGKKQNTHISLSDFVSLCVEHKKQKASKGSLKIYKTIQRFLQHKNLNIRLSDITHHYLREFENEVRKITNSPNTLWSYMKRLRAIIYYAIKLEYMSVNPFLKYDMPTFKQVKKTFLSPLEVKQLETLLDSGKLGEYDKQYTLVLSWFLFSVWTGLRYKDIEHFSFSNITNDNIILSTQKTGSIVSIPIHDNLQKAIARIKNKPKIISNQKANDYLKEIAVIAEIPKSISFHTARHTFGYLCAYLDIRPEIAQKWLGHSNIKTTMIYYHLTGKEFNEQASKFNTL